MRDGKKKVLAYITQGERLLVFREPDFPEAGVQAPGGTVEDGEDLETAVLREAREETGLTDLTIAAYLGIQEWEHAGRRVFHHGFHLICRQPTPDRWRHYEADPSDGSPPILLELYWAPLPHGVPPLAGGRNAFLPHLLDKMAR